MGLTFGRARGRETFPAGSEGGQLSGVGFLRGQKHLGSSSQCVILISLRPWLGTKRPGETLLIEQGHQDRDPALAKDTDQA